MQEDIILASVSDIERRLREITVTGVSRKADKESILSPGKDTAIWILISSASVAEYQSDLRAKEHNARWRLALLANKTVIMGTILDPRYFQLSMYSYSMLHLFLLCTCMD